MKRLYLGCGTKKKEGWVNVDNWVGCRPDVLHDLNKYPYPFKDNYADEIWIEHCLEHLENWEQCLKEMWRITKPTGTIKIEVPNFNYGWTNSYHKTAFNKITIDLFHRYNNKEYFKVIKIKQVWTRHQKDGILYKLLWFPNTLFTFLANCLGSPTQTFADRIWGGWVGGFENLIFILRPLK